MKYLFMAAFAVLLALPASLAAQATYDHGEVGVYGDLFRIAPSGFGATNYLGLGARAGFNVHRYIALEAEMNYDFEKNFTSVNGTGGTSATITSRVRPITGLFGPKFQFGSSGPFRAFLEGKAGFIDITSSCNAPAGSGSCFSTSLQNFGGSSTHFAAFRAGVSRASLALSGCVWT